MDQMYIQAYGHFITEHMKKGWNGYLLSFMFNQLKGSPTGIQNQMFQEVERVYGKVLTRIVRKPRSKTMIGKLPIWIAVPDFPVFKHERKSLRDVTVNSGRHVHAMALIPPTSRLEVGLDEHFQQYQGLYLGEARKLCRIDVQIIDRAPAYVTDYAFKCLKRGWASGDDVLILPKTRSELPEKRFLSLD